LLEGMYLYAQYRGWLCKMFFIWWKFQ
jgi:hypothetical protein